MLISIRVYVVILLVGHNQAINLCMHNFICRNCSTSRRGRLTAQTKQLCTRTHQYWPTTRSLSI